MRRLLAVLAAFAATLVVVGPAHAQDPNFRKPVPQAKAQKLRIERTQDIESRKSKVYVVQMAAQPAMAYEGGIAGYARTKPEKGARYDAHSTAAKMYANRLALEQDRVLARAGAPSSKLYSYQHSFNGFAAKLTPAQVAKLKKDKSVLNVWEDKAVKLDTNNSPKFLHLYNPDKGLHSKHKLKGRGVIIGMLDSGAVPEHPSFDDTGMKPPKKKDWHGICQPGEGWSENDCNNKLIGARYFNAGFLSALEVEPGEFLSARDSDGHGTHTATTAAGRRTRASLGGTPLAMVEGMAPLAYVAIYKPCWEDLGGDQGASCFFSDSAAATEAAIMDGVDVISFSVGTSFSYTDPTDLAFLNAVNAGIFVSRSAGNEGPAPGTTAAGEPWVISVAASTQRGTAFANALRVNSPGSVAGDYPSIEGAITKPLALTGPITGNLEAANPIDACTPIQPVGSIALIERGGCDFVVKVANAVDAGAQAVVVYTNPATNPKVVMGGDDSFDIPGVMIDNDVGLALRAALDAGQSVNVTMSSSVFMTEQLTPNVMAGFSSRGPYPTVSDWIKPDVTAPGVRILAGHTPEPNDGSVGGFFQYLQGTSMSTPHVTGIAALLREAHPDWSPAMIKSAIMTTARQNLVKEDGVTPADPFDFGAGHIQPNKAIDPGLVYDAGLLDYLAASCGTSTPLVSPADCGTLESLGFSLDSADLNLPSIGVGAVLGEQTVRRSVTNVGKGVAEYEVNVKAPKGFRVQAKPRKLRLRPGQTKSYTLKITNIDAPAGEWRFGFLTWKDDKNHRVRSPIALRAQAVEAPADIEGTGAEGATSFDIGFGYNGAYVPGAHGLVEPFLTLDQVTQDPDQTFDFLGPGETLAYLLEIPEGTVHAQWSLFDAYTNGNHDLDLYLFYCPNFSCTQVDFSGSPTSEERVSVSFPLNDPSIPDPYAVIVHGFTTEGGNPAQFILFDWTDPGVAEDLGNMTVSAPGTAAIGTTATVDVAWSGLATGPFAKYVGAVSHGDGTGIRGLTTVNIENDEGTTFCDVVACP